MSFLGSIFSLLFMMAFFYLEKQQKGGIKPSLAVSDLSFFKKKALFSVAFKRYCFFAAFFCFSLALAHPHFRSYQKRQERQTLSQTEGLAIYLLLDRSGSMKESVITQLKEGRPVQISKMDLLKRVTKDLIEGESAFELKGRNQDLIGLIAFARTASLLSPLTLDHASLIEQISSLKPLEEEDQNGTAIGYAIYKAASLIASMKAFKEEKGKQKTPYTIKNQILILMTDGFQDPNRLDERNPLRTMDPKVAAEYAKQQGISLYIISLEPKMGVDEFSAQRNLMQKTAEITGGQFFLVDQTKSLKQIYSILDHLEKNVIESQQPSSIFFEEVFLFPYFLGLGMLFLAIWMFLQTQFLRSFP